MLIGIMQVSNNVYNVVANKGDVAHSINYKYYPP